MAEQWFVRSGAAVLVLGVIAIGSGFPVITSTDERCVQRFAWEAYVRARRAS